jgi:hypothetical protein
MVVRAMSSLIWSRLTSQQRSEIKLIVRGAHIQKVATRAHATTRTATTIGDHNNRGTQLVPTDSRLFPQ